MSNEHENPKETPLMKHMLHTDLEGHGSRSTWNYIMQAVGMMGYLQGSTRHAIELIK